MRGQTNWEKIVRSQKDTRGQTFIMPLLRGQIENVVLISDAVRHFPLFIKVVGVYRA